MATRKNTLARDIKRLQTVARKMLVRLEQELDQDLPKSEADIKLCQKVHEWLFGAKTPPMDALASLADLMLKLAQNDGGDETGAQSMPDLTPADITLIEEFARKLQPE